MRRLFWLGVGAAIGIYAVRRFDRVKAELPRAAARAVGQFADDVRSAMHQREGELRDALGIGDPGVVRGERPVPGRGVLDPPGPRADDWSDPADEGVRRADRIEAIPGLVTEAPFHHDRSH